MQLYFKLSQFSFLYLSINPIFLWLLDILCAKELVYVTDRAAVRADFVVNRVQVNPLPWWLWALQSQAGALRACVLNDCSMLSFADVCFCYSVQSGPMRWSSRLEWSLNCIRMFLCSTLPKRGGNRSRACLCLWKQFVCENNLQKKFRVP